MLSSRQVRDLATRLLPPGRVEQALRAVRPTWRLVPAEGGPVCIGGPAPLGESETWPVNPRGVPLTFIAAIATSGLPSMPETPGGPLSWPHAGPVLRLFADLASTPYEGSALCVLVGEAGDLLSEREHPGLPDPWPVDPVSNDYADHLDPEDRLAVLGRMGCSCEPSLTAAPYAFGTRFETDPDPDLAAYEQFICELRWSEYPQSLGSAQLFGEPLLIQDDPRLTDGYGDLDEDSSAWTVLLELHAGFGDRLFDSGAYTACVATEDLDQGRYDRAFCAFYRS